MIKLTQTLLKRRTALDILLSEHWQSDNHQQLANDIHISANHSPISQYIYIWQTKQTLVPLHFLPPPMEDAEAVAGQRTTGVFSGRH
jgi:hypothetical protein